MPITPVNAPGGVLSGVWFRTTRRHLWRALRRSWRACSPIASTYKKVLRHTPAWLVSLCVVAAHYGSSGRHHAVHRKLLDPDKVDDVFARQPPAQKTPYPAAMGRVQSDCFYKRLGKKRPSFSSTGCANIGLSSPWWLSALWHQGHIFNFSTGSPSFRSVPWLWRCSCSSAHRPWSSGSQPSSMGASPEPVDERPVLAHEHSGARCQRLKGQRHQHLRLAPLCEALIRIRILRHELGGLCRLIPCF
jgi:hypothetical protein